MSVRISRRRLNVGLGLAAGLASFGSSIQLPSLPGLEAELLLHRLVELVSLPDPAEIGRLYLEAHPGDNDLTRLLVQAFHTEEEFIARQEADFEQGRILTLDGWRLAHTDARLCAIAALVGW